MVIARSKHPNHTHTEGVVMIQFKGHQYRTDKRDEIEILKKYDPLYWKIIQDTEKVTKKPESETPKVDYSNMKRNVLYRMAKEKGYNAKYVESTNALLIEFLEAQ